MSFLKRLFGKKEQVPLEVPIEFLQADPPDWLLDLKVSALPGGESFEAKVRMMAQTRTGSATIALQPASGKGAPQSVTADLSQIEGGRLMVLLGFSFPNDIGDVGAQIEEGISAKLYVHRREPYLLKEGSCNLANWLDSKKSRPPTVEIAMILLGVKERACNQK